jgi:hypothetical protein
MLLQSFSVSSVVTLNAISEARRKLFDPIEELSSKQRRNTALGAAPIPRVYLTRAPFGLNRIVDLARRKTISPNL